MKKEKQSKNKQCKMWMYISLLLLFFLMGVTQYGKILRFFYGRELKFSNGSIRVLGNYYIIPNNRKDIDELKMLGGVFRDLCDIPICKVYDFSDVHFKSKKTSESIYEFIKKNWLANGRIVRHRKLGNLKFDEWYAFEKGKAGYIVVIFPQYNLLFSFYNSSQIDDFLQHMTISRKTNNK